MNKKYWKIRYEIGIFLLSARALFDPCGYTTTNKWKKHTEVVLVVWFEFDWWMDGRERVLSRFHWARINRTVWLRFLWLKLNQGLYWKEKTGLLDYWIIEGVICEEDRNSEWKRCMTRREVEKQRLIRFMRNFAFRSFVNCYLQICAIFFFFLFRFG